MAPREDNMTTDNKHDLLQWSDEFSVGVPGIDDQHRTLFDLVNKIHAAILEHKGTAACTEVLNELVNYTRIHFTVEECIMQITEFPGYEQHCALHHELVHDVVVLQEKIHSGKAAISFELLQFLRNWLTKHILGEDMKYADFFAAGGDDGTQKPKKPWWKFW